MFDNGDVIYSCLLSADFAVEVNTMPDARETRDMAMVISRVTVTL